MIEITGALTAARGLLDIAKTALDARDDAKARQALSDLQMRLFDATSAALQMSEKAAALQEALLKTQNECRELQAHAAERETYTLAELRAGAYAYARKPAQDGDQHQPPYLCQPCYDKGVKAVLRLKPAGPAQEAKLECPVEQAHTIGMGGALPWPKTITTVRRGY